MKILVTGAGGFIGSHVADALANDGHEVVGIDDFSGGEERNTINRKWTLVQSSIVTGDMEWIVKQYEPEVLYHLAANAREGASQFQPLNVTERNYYGYMRLLEPLIAKNLKKVVLFSSMATYGKQTPPFREDMETKPEDIYAINKVAMEETTKVLADVHGFNWTIIRPHNVFGPRQSLRDSKRNVLGIWMNCIMRGERAWIFGDGEQTRAFSYIEDSLPCYVKCLNFGENQIYNIGGIKPYTINESWKVVQQAMGVENYPVQYLPLRPREVKFAYCDQTKAKQKLEYEDKVGFEKGVQKMAEWAKSVGPQEWMEEKLSIVNDKTPSVWV